jgi:hypothetical protein
MQPDLIDVPAERNTREHGGERVRQDLPETQHVIRAYKKLYKWDCLSSGLVFYCDWPTPILL